MTTIVFFFFPEEPGIGKTSALASTALEWARKTGMKCQSLIKDFFPKFVKDNQSHGHFITMSMLQESRKLGFLES